MHVDIERAKTFDERLAPSCHVLTKYIEAHANRRGEVAIRALAAIVEARLKSAPLMGLQVLETLADPGPQDQGRRPC